MDIKSQLEELDKLYYEHEGEIFEDVVASMRHLHGEAMQDPEAYTEFVQEAPNVCGGAYIPHLFWIELSRLGTEQENIDEMQRLLIAFTESDFEGPVMTQMKPLVAVFGAKASDFEVNRMKSKVVAKAHPSVKEWFEKHLHFETTSPGALKAYEQKFDLLKHYFPNYQLFELPLDEIEAQLAAMQQAQQAQAEGAEVEAEEEEAEA